MGGIWKLDRQRRAAGPGARGSGIVGYNVQVAVDAERHMILTHEVLVMTRNSSR
jgi:hypothetical protein